MWEALEEVCSRENLSVHELCTQIEVRRTGSSRTAAVRAFILGYFREAASDTGHVRAGHGAMGQTRTAPRGQGNGAKKSRVITELRSSH